MTSEFLEIFDGQKRGHGVYQVLGKPDPVTGKVGGRAFTVMEAVDETKWRDHLAGKVGLGCIPIRDDATCKWGAIDIDVYKDLDPKPLIAEVAALNLPLILCRSKSGGIHAFLFITEFVPAALVQSKLREWASLLGLGSCEVFPKQVSLMVEHKDLGNWINMPYFGVERWAMDQHGELIDAEAFLERVRKTRVSGSTLRGMEVRKPEILAGGPPCLQQILSRGAVPSGGRNNTLFSIGVYCRKAFPEDWEEKVRELNQKHMSPPLSDEEVTVLIKSLAKKDYFYPCNKPPLSSWCNKLECRKCAHGIGENSVGAPVVGTMTRVNTEPPIFFLDVEGGGRLMLDAAALQNQRRFQLSCIHQLNTIPAPVKNDEWREMVANLLKTQTIVEVPVEVTPEGVLRTHLITFLTRTPPGSLFDELLLGRVIHVDGEYGFRDYDFQAFLQRVKYKGLEPNKVVELLLRWGARSETISLPGPRATQVQLWRIPSLGTAKPTESTAPPVETPY